MAGVAATGGAAQKPAKDAKRYIKLNVGGQLFSTTRDTLSKQGQVWLQDPPADLALKHASLPPAHAVGHVQRAHGAQRGRGRVKKNNKALAKQSTRSSSQK